MVTVDELKVKYADKYEITKGKDGWLRIRGLTPLGNEFPSPQKPAFLDYNVEVLDPRFSDNLDDRTRNVWMRNSEGRGFRHVSYCSGFGIWQVSEGIQPIPFDDLNPTNQEMVTQWLSLMDKYISQSIPELEQLIRERTK